MASRISHTIPKAAVVVRFSDPDTGPVEWRFPLAKVKFRPDVEDGESFTDGVCSFKDPDRLVGMQIDGYATVPEGGNTLAGFMLRRNVDDLVTELATAVNDRRPVKVWRAVRALVADGRRMLLAKEAMIL